jgi:CO/xanthine dehydrogenase Mo-binding subunit
MLPEWMPNMMKGGIGAALGGMMNLAGADPIASEGAKQAYDLPYDLSTVVQDVKLPTAFWRSVANSHNGFVVESFVDEVAAALKINPLEFRQQLLAKDQRALNVLNLVAEKSQFMRLSPRRGYGFGIAYHKSFESHVAEVAEVEVSDGQIKVLKVTCAVDCGRVVNPHIVVAQMRSGIIFGLSAALYGKITFRDGVAEQDNYDTYPILKLSETPAIDVHIVASTANPTGVGEPGLPPIAAAVANAVTMATGKRPRDLPFVLVS